MLESKHFATDPPIDSQTSELIMAPRMPTIHASQYFYGSLIDSRTCACPHSEKSSTVDVAPTIRSLSRSMPLLQAVGNSS